MGAIAVLAIIFLMTDPPRGKADGSHLKPTSPISDMKERIFKGPMFTHIVYCCLRQKLTLTTIASVFTDLGVFTVFYSAPIVELMRQQGSL